ncbi:MAG: hypothetical protein IJI56_06690 [Firmicutes bacterium]|nr:hypothetical protein [Bacillota bacterium]
MIYRYGVKYCPNCKTPIDKYGPGVTTYFSGNGDPIIGCMVCGARFVDKDIKELGLQGKKTVFDNQEEYDRSIIRLKNRNYLDRLAASGFVVPKYLYQDCEEDPNKVISMLLQKPRIEKPRCDYPHDLELVRMICEAGKQVLNRINREDESLTSYWNSFFEEVLNEMIKHYQNLSDVVVRAKEAFDNQELVIDSRAYISDIDQEYKPLGIVYLILRYALWKEQPKDIAEANARNTTIKALTGVVTDYGHSALEILKTHEIKERDPEPLDNKTWKDIFKKALKLSGISDDVIEKVAEMSNEFEIQSMITRIADFNKNFGVPKDSDIIRIAEDVTGKTIMQNQTSVSYIEELRELKNY